MYGDQASSKEKQVQIGKMKAICFLLSANQKMYSFLLKQLRDGENVGRDDYSATTTSELDLLIRTEVGGFGNKQSTYDNRGSR